MNPISESAITIGRHFHGIDANIGHRKPNDFICPVIIFCGFSSIFEKKKNCKINLFEYRLSVGENIDQQISVTA